MASLLSGFGVDYRNISKENDLVNHTANELMRLQSKGIESFLKQVQSMYKVDNIASTHYQGSETTYYTFYPEGNIVAKCKNWREFNNNSLSFIVRCEGNIF